MTTFAFTAFSESDLIEHGHIARHAVFTMPGSPTLKVEVTDDDEFLSGDAHRNERGDDVSGQNATILRDGTEIGNLGTLYAEQVWTLKGSDGEVYRLVELEQPGFLEDNFTFLGPIPAAGVTLTVGHKTNVFGQGIRFSELGAGEIPSALPNIVEIAASSDDFNILVRALATADLVETVQNASDITVFAPTDAAFTQLAVDLGFDGDPSDENAVFGYIAEQLTVLGGGDPIPLLTDILLYHVAGGTPKAADLGTVETLQGATFAANGLELVDNEPDIENPTIIAADIAASNGAVQVIDRVLLPIDVPGNSAPVEELPTLTGIVAASGGEFDQDGTDFDLLLNAVQAAGLAGALDDPDADLTVFAPNDAAFVGLAQALGFTGDNEGEAFGYIVEALTLLGGGDPIPLLTAILTYHIAPGSLDSSDVLGSTAIATLQGGTLGVSGASLVDADPDLADPNLIATDIKASNGIAHVIDGVLLPVDVLASDGSNDVDFIIAGDNRDFIRTGRDNDFVDGNGGNDRIYLGSGDDVGFGGSGHDVIRGGKGDDTITGGTGNDYMFGGSGMDTFVFATGDGFDRIYRFESGEDKIDLSGTEFTDFESLSIHRINSWKVIVELGQGDDILLTGRHVEVNEADFLFG